MERRFIVNPHLEGEPFFWPGGPDGVLLVHGYTATTAADGTYTIAGLADGTNVPYANSVEFFLTNEYG